MRAGVLRHRVQFQSLVVELDSDGAQVKTWVNAFPTLLPAEIRPLSGKALMAAQAVQSKVNTTIRVRQRPGFKPSMRGVHRGVFYNIEAIVPDQESGVQYLSLSCSSGVNPG